MKKSHFIKKSLVWFMLVFAHSTFGQQNLTLYGLNQTSQALNVNPGFRQKNRVYISLPIGFQNFYLNNSGFTVKRLFTKVPGGSTADSYKLNLPNVYSKMSPLNYVLFDNHNEILGVGFKVKKNNYFSFNMNHRFRTYFAYPKGLMDFLINGNGDPKNLGNRIDMDGLKFDMSDYIEYAFGYNRNINAKLTVGGKVKLISGIANIQTKKSTLGLTTDPTTFNLKLDGKFDVRSSNTLFLADTLNDLNNSNFLESPYNFKNFGLGFDLGASYILNDKLSFSGSILDLGFISWKANVQNYLYDRTIEFKGIDVDRLLYDTTYKADQAFKDVPTKLSDLNPSNTKYVTSLHAKFYIGAQYQLNKIFNTSFTLYNEFNRSKYRVGTALALNMNLKNWLSVGLNYNTYGKSFNNLGFGFNIKGGPIQFFVMSDNVLTYMRQASVNMNTFSSNKSVTLPYNSNNLHLSFGLNVVIGPLKDKDGDGIKDKKDECPELAGDIKFHGCPDRDNDSIIDPEDLCPDVAGLKYLKGCPDKDNDSITDKEDECPDIAGLRKFKGCPDKDNDSIIDSKDDCPDIAGLIAFNGCPDQDGDGIKDSEDECPDKAGLLVNKGCPDTDKDGVLDKNDACIDVSGPAENKGCPWPDYDGDGLLDKDDKCPYIAGPIKNQGCPYQDTDGDGVYDDADRCPTVKGVPENNGCPKIAEAEQEILNTAFENLEFQTGKAIIKPSSFASLDDLAALLVKKKDWKLQIAGHTDNVGNDAANMKLSKQRADAVKVYLSKKGVDVKRLSAIAFGETQPIAPNTTEEGRTKNRRVEMTVIFK